VFGLKDRTVPRDHSDRLVPLDIPVLLDRRVTLDLPDHLECVDSLEDLDSMDLSVVII